MGGRLSDLCHLREGRLWPSADWATWTEVRKDLSHLPKILENCEQHRTAIQAGGNCGLVPAAIAPHFDTVYTFEPDPLAFHCLVANADSPNVIFHQAALGESQGFVAMETTDPTNIGGTRVAINPVPALRRIPRYALDDLGIDDVDLIWLDVEGFELDVLRGAAMTIDIWRPTIVVELRGRGRRYGHDDQAVREWLHGREYAPVGKAGCDEIWSPNL